MQNLPHVTRERLDQLNKIVTDFDNARCAYEVHRSQSTYDEYVRLQHIVYALWTHYHTDVDSGDVEYK
jgi:hypothetical protein